MLQRILSAPLIVGIIGLAFIFSGCASIEKAQELKRDGKTREALEMAKPYLSDEDPKIRVKAINLIGSIDSDESGRLITPSLDDKNMSVKHAAIKNITFLRYEPASGKLVKLVPFARGETFDLLSTAFRKIGGQTTDDLIKSFDAPSNKGDRAVYVKMFKAIGPSIANSLTKSLEGKSAFENRDKFEILISLKNPKVAAILVKYIDDDSLGELVISGLVKLGHMSAIPSIKELQKRMKESGQNQAKERLIRVLGDIKDKRAIEVLEKLTTDDSDQIRAAADDALLKVRGF
ncbi:MAG: hypothetical protein GY786_16380 [Proteobacteria bacterium]|nr:hypothetical protein [Pseudomonadota bacterium]